MFGKLPFKQAFLLIALFTFCLLLSLITTSPLAQIVKGGDRELYLYIGMLISKGYVPYVDVFDNKPPLIYFLASQGWWVLWWINSIALSLSALMFYQFCKRYLAYPLGLSLLYIILLHFPVLDGGGLTYEFTAALAMIAACISLSNQPNYILLGLLSSMVLFTQVNDTLGLMPLIAYAVFSKTWAAENKPLAFIGFSSLFLLGFAAFSALILGYFAYHHALKNLFDDAFLFNLTIYVPHTNHFGLIGTLYKYLHGAYSEYLLPFLLIAVIGNAALVLKKSQTALLRTFSLVLLLSLVFDAFSVTLSGWFVSFYYLNSVIYFSLSLAVFLASMRPFLKDFYLKALLAFAIAISLGVCLHTERHSIAKFVDFVNHPSQTAYEAFVSPYESLVSDVKGQDGQVYVYRRYGLAQAIYKDLKIKAPSYWTYTYFWDWYPFWDVDNSMFNGIIADINQAHCKYIMDFSLSNPPSRPAVKKAWAAMLAEHYQKTQALYCSSDDYGNDPKLCGYLYVRKN